MCFKVYKVETYFIKTHIVCMRHIWNLTRRTVWEQHPTPERQTTSCVISNRSLEWVQRNWAAAPIEALDRTPAFTQTPSPLPTPPSTTHIYTRLHTPVFVHIDVFNILCLTLWIFLIIINTKPDGRAQLKI